MSLNIFRQTMRCRSSAVILLVGLLGNFSILKAEVANGWLFDSLSHAAAQANPEGQQIYEVLLNLLDRWNAHDVDGYMDGYWKSPNLLVVVDSEQYNGWEQLRESYLNSYPNKDSMGHITPSRIQIRLLKPDLALALTWWSMSFPNSRQKVVGNSTINLERFEDGWKIVASHSSTAEM